MMIKLRGLRPSFFIYNIYVYMENSTFCILPFVHMATHPNGDVTPCCESQFKPMNGDKKLDLNVNTIDEIRSSETFTELRDSFIKNKKHSACSICWDRESKGIESRRIRENDNHGVNEITKGYFIDKMPLLNVELRLGNICNAKCLICQPHSSSKWNEDVDALQKIKFNTVTNYQHYRIEREWYRGNKLYDQLINKYDNINHLWFNGGEPTLIKEHYKFLQELINNGKSKKISLEYNINGSQVPDELIAIWKEFRHVGVTVSMDDIGDRLYYSRFPTKWEDVKNSIYKLEENDITYTIIPTVSLLNIHNIVEIFKYIDENFKKGNLPGINFVVHPPFLSVNNLDNESKEKIKEKVKNSNLDDDRIGVGTRASHIIYHLDQEPTHGLKPFKIFINTLDKQRNVNILDYLPEYKRLFGPNLI